MNGNDNQPHWDAKRLIQEYPLQHNSNKIDDIIVILLGDKFKQVFAEEMLQADYGYPKETDSELFEWDYDN